ncbi:MAG: hypothetical protein D3916_14345 [Candidatus Electrothrix sp. MAN1_4]|nr:hypothetical protein [Candidatus Electrothrix sp. MAN1_4]
MRITKTVVLFSSFSLFLSLSACKQPSNEEPKIQEPVISAAPPEITKKAPQTSQETAPAEEILVDDSDASQKSIEITDKDFGCIRDMQQVGVMYIANLLGNIDATEAVANSEEGGVYPPGTVVQLVPGEAMVKREKGFNAATNDWEFFILNVSAEGSQIANRGGAEVNNRFGQNCLSCHAQAEPKWDMICGTGHGCTPIPITRDMIVALQKTDQRCAPMDLSEIDKKALADLHKLIAAFKDAQAAAAPATTEEVEATEAEPSEETGEEVTETEEPALDLEVGEKVTETEEPAPVAEEEEEKSKE